MRQKEELLDWQQHRVAQQKEDYFLQLQNVLEQETSQGITIYPPKDQHFAAFELTPLNQVKVVILGQDPYHGAGQAHGLAFSVPKGIAIPPSLNNIFKALQHDLDIPPPQHGDLTGWARQGVLLLNTALTVQADKANSHAKIGWQCFTDSVIKTLNQRQQPMIFLMWGKHAQAKIPLITRSHHHILTAAHPSPLSAYRGFLTCQHFSKANQWLMQQQLPAIQWQLDQ